MPGFVVAAEQAGERLDRFLARAQADLSRSRLQALIESGLVRVNGRVPRAAQRLRAEDRIELELPPARVSTIVPEAIELNVVFEDEALLVLDKPAGLVVHPGAGVASGTIVHALLHRDPAIAGVGGEGRQGSFTGSTGTPRVSWWSRARAAYRALVEAMQARLVKRLYLALVWGDVQGEHGVIDAAVGRVRGIASMAVVKRGGRAARTHWSVTERFGLVTALELALETGRTHQIRVHFAHLGHPVVGDPTYGGRTRKMLSLRESAYRRGSAGGAAAAGTACVHWNSITR
jgi:23S rRNA pseudouridine1911/1915/1917 synthase